MMSRDVIILSALVRNQIRLTMRIRIAVFFSVIMPLLMFFIYTFVFGKGNARAVPILMGPIIVFTIVSNAIYGIGMQWVEMRERGTLRSYRMTPIAPAHLLISRLLTNYFVLLFILIIQFLLAFFIFGVVPDNFLFLFMVISIGIFSICSVGLFIASLVNSTQEANIISQLSFLTILFLSGLTVPLDSLPKVLQYISLFFPSTHLVLMIKLLMTHGKIGWMQGLELMAMSLAGACFFCVANALFRWDRYSKINLVTKNFALLSLLPYLACGLVINLLS